MKIINLQFIGNCEAKKAVDFKIGEFFKWNYGSISEIVEIIKETKFFIIFKTKSIDCDNQVFYFERRLKKDRLVAIGN